MKLGGEGRGAEHGDWLFIGDAANFLSRRVSSPF